MVFRASAERIPVELRGGALAFRAAVFFFPAVWECWLLERLRVAGIKLYPSRDDFPPQKLVKQSGDSVPQNGGIADLRAISFSP